MIEIRQTFQSIREILAALSLLGHDTAIGRAVEYPKNVFDKGAGIGCRLVPSISIRAEHKNNGPTVAAAMF